jgi:hypothetical protein
MAEIILYCPRCAERVHRKALTLDFNEIVTCKACSAPVKAASLLTDEGKNLLDYLALLSVKAAKGSKEKD